MLSCNYINALVGCDFHLEDHILELMTACKRKILQFLVFLTQTLEGFRFVGNVKIDLFF